MLRLAALGAALFSACGGPLAKDLAKAPDLDIKDQSKCKVSQSQARPLIVEWPSADRGALEAQLTKGTVVVRYQGCEMQVLRRCEAPGVYDYVPITHKRDRITMRDADDLYANVPLGAAKLEGKLERAGELTVTMTMVGSYEAQALDVRKDQLVGDCGEATHVITSLTAGAFSFFAGADAAVGGSVSTPFAGGSANSSASHEVLNQDGDEKACEIASGEDQGPPHNCGALLRIEVAPLLAAAPAPTPAPVAVNIGTGQPAPAPAPAPAAVTSGMRVFNQTAGLIASVQWKYCGDPAANYAPYAGSTIQPGGSFLIPVSQSCLDLAIINAKGRIIRRQQGIEIVAGGQWVVK